MTITRQEYRDSNCFAHLAKEVTKLKLLLTHQQQEITELRYESDILLNGPLKWQQTQNMYIKEPNLLKMDDNPNFNFGFAQSDQALEPTKSYFKIHLSTSMDSVKVWIGLTRKGYPPKTVSEKQSIKYQGHYVKDDIDNHLVFLKCKSGDVIQCGIDFPEDFVNDGSHHSASVYVSVNQKFIFRKPFVIPTDGFFPTVFLRDTFVNVRYYQQIK